MLRLRGEVKRHRALNTRRPHVKMLQMQIQLAVVAAPQELEQTDQRLP